MCWGLRVRWRGGPALLESHGDGEIEGSSIGRELDGFAWVLTEESRSNSLASHRIKPSEAQRGKVT